MNEPSLLQAQGPAAPIDSLAQIEQKLSADAAFFARAFDLLGVFAVNLTVAAIIFVATLLAARWAASAARKVLSRTQAVRRDPTVLSFMVQIVRVVVIIVGMIAVLQRLGVQTTSIIAVLGAASLAVGLALQGTLSNVAAGVMLLLLRPYRVGESIIVAGVSGSVAKLDLFTTVMTTGGNDRIIIPNSKVLSEIITNQSDHSTRRVTIGFKVAYGQDMDKARALLSDIAVQHPAVLKNPAVWTGVTALLDNAVEVTLHAWVKTNQHFQTSADLMQSGEQALQAAHMGVSPAQQLTIAVPPAGIGANS